MQFPLLSRSSRFLSLKLQEDSGEETGSKLVLSEPAACKALTERVNELSEWKLLKQHSVSGRGNTLLTLLQLRSRFKPMVSQLSAKLRMLTNSPANYRPR